MTDKLIEWDRDRLLIALSTPEGNRAAFRSIQVVPRGTNSADTVSLIEPLRQFFGGTGDRKKPGITVVFPRQLVTIHRIQLPAVPDTEIPDMIRLQASMRLTVPVESVCMDFAPLPVPPGSQTRDVLLVTVPNEQVEVVRRTLDAAGLELAEARVSAFCVAQAAARAGLTAADTGSGLVDIVVMMRRDFVELTFLRGASVVFSHSGSSWTSPDSIERTIRAELSRARLSAAEALGEHKIGRMILVGAPEFTAAVTDQITARVEGARLERIDPSAVFISGAVPADVSAADMVALAGAAAAGIETRSPAVDLINPRRAPEKKDMRRTWVLLGALSAVLLFAAVHMWRKREMDRLDGALTALNRSNTETRDTVQAGIPETERAARVQDWVDRDIRWLDEMTKLKAILPGTDRMFVDNLTFQVIQRNGIGTIKLEGFAKSEQDINDLARRLRDAGYGLKPYEPEFRASAAQDYGVKIVLEISLPEVSAASAS